MGRFAKQNVGGPVSAEEQQFRVMVPEGSPDRPPHDYLNPEGDADELDTPEVPLGGRAQADLPALYVLRTGGNPVGKHDTPRSPHRQHDPRVTAHAAVGDPAPHWSKMRPPTLFEDIEATPEQWKKYKDDAKHRVQEYLGTEGRHGPKRAQTPEEVAYDGYSWRESARRTGSMWDWAVWEEVQRLARDIGFEYKPELTEQDVFDDPRMDDPERVLPEKEARVWGRVGDAADKAVTDWRNYNSVPKLLEFLHSEKGKLWRKHALRELWSSVFADSDEPRHAGGLGGMPREWTYRPFPGLQALKQARSFQEALDTPVTVYRGVTRGEAENPRRRALVSYTTSPEMAQMFAEGYLSSTNVPGQGRVFERKVRFGDLLGFVNPDGELEVLLSPPGRTVEKEMLPGLYLVQGVVEKHDTPRSPHRVHDPRRRRGGREPQRQALVASFNRSRTRLLRELQAEFGQDTVTDLRLLGSVLDPERFGPGSDVDVAVIVPLSWRTRNAVGRLQQKLYEVGPAALTVEFEGEAFALDPITMNEGEWRLWSHGREDIRRAQGISEGEAEPVAGYRLGSPPRVRKHDTPRSEHCEHDTRAECRVAGVQFVDERADAGRPRETRVRLTRRQVGKLGEELAVAYLKQLGYDDARLINVSQENFAVDGVADHEVFEVKAGLVSNGRSARQWRATLGQPGKAEAEWLRTASPEEKRDWNSAKQEAVLRRKDGALRFLSEELGRRVGSKTVSFIIDPDRRVADVFVFDGFHLRIGWDGEAAQSGYVGSVRYD